MPYIVCGVCACAVCYLYVIARGLSVTCTQHEFVCVRGRGIYRCLRPPLLALELGWREEGGLLCHCPCPCREESDQGGPL